MNYKYALKLLEKKGVGQRKNNINQDGLVVQREEGGRGKGKKKGEEGRRGGGWGGIERGGEGREEESW